MSIQLTVMSLDFDAKTGPITKIFDKDEITLGRLPNNDLVLDRPEVSAYHAKLRIVEGEGSAGTTLFVKDLGSSYGTMVENKSLKAQVEIEIQPNQRIIIGNYLIKPMPVENSSAKDSSRSRSSFAASSMLKPSALFGLDKITDKMPDNIPDSIPDNIIEKEDLVSTQRVIAYEDLEWSESENDDDSNHETISMSRDQLGLEEIDLDSFEPVAVNGPTKHESAYSFNTFSATPDISIAPERNSSSSKVEPMKWEFSEPKTDDSAEIFSFSTEKFATERSATEKFKSEKFSAERTVEEKPKFMEHLTRESIVNTELDISREMPRSSFTSSFEAVRDQSKSDTTPFSSSLSGELSSGSSAAGMASIVVGNSNVVDIDFEAQQLLAFEGRIVHKGNYLSDVEVTLKGFGSCLTDATGAYRFDGIVEGSPISLEVKKPGYRFNLNQIPNNLDIDLSVEVPATKLFSITGRAIHRGAPLAGVTVDAGNLGVCVTSNDGSFSFSNVAEGTNYELTLKKDQFMFSQSTVKGSLIDRDVAHEVSAVQLFSVSGKITHNGKPLAGVIVDGGPNLGKTTTDSEGRYLFANVPENTKYTLTAQRDKYRFAPKQ